MMNKDDSKYDEVKHPEQIQIFEKMDHYKPDFDAYKPKFKGRHENEFPPTWKDWVLQFVACVPLFVVAGLIFWGLMVWGLHSNVSYGWFCFGIFIGFIVTLNLLVFIFGSDRRKRERECIAAKYKENMAKREEKLLLAEQNAKILREYQKESGKALRTESDFGLLS